MSPTVIAFIGPAGCGKTSLIRALAASALGAAPLFSDTYKSVAIWGPRYRSLGLSNDAAIEQWFADGAPADGYCSIPRLVEDLKSLRAGRPIHTPSPMPDGGEQEIQPAPYILLEDTWASRTELNGLVDFIIQLSIPFDIALARYVQRDAAQGRDIAGLAAGYLKHGSRYVRAVDALKNRANLILDALKPQADLTAETLRWIATTLRPAR